MNTIQTLIDACALGAVYALMAVGIGLVFGVLRLVNFAYGQLIMAGAYTLALTNGWNPALCIVICFAVVIGLTMTMEVVAFRPLRNAVAGDDARRHLRDQLPAPVHRPAQVRRAGEDGRHADRAEPPDRRRHAARPLDLDRRRSSSPPVALAALAAPAEPDEPRPAHARGGGRLPDRAPARRARERGDLVAVAPLGRARRDGRAC